MNSILQALKPTERELEQLALRETDPQLHQEFEPFTRGPLYAVCILAFVALCAIVAIPWRLAKRILGVDQ